MQIVKCDSLTIVYDDCGDATITMTVYSNEPEIDIDALPHVFGGVTFEYTKHHISGRQIDRSGIYMYTVKLEGRGK